MGLRRLLGGWESIGGGCPQRRDLDFALHSCAVNEHCFFEHESRPFVARAFSEFCVAAEFGFDHDKLVDALGHAHTQSHQLAKPSISPAARQQEFLPADCSVKPK